MQYTREEFFRLMEQIEADGGDHLDKTHDPSVFTELVGGPVLDPKQGFVRNCGENALFRVAYEPSGHDGTLETLEVCAVDDMMGRWPRFVAARAAGEA